MDGLLALAMRAGWRSKPGFGALLLGMGISTSTFAVAIMRARELRLAASVPFAFQEAREYYGPTVDGVKALIIGRVAVTLAIIAGWIWMLWTAPAGRSQKARPVEAPSRIDFRTRPGSRG